MRSFCYGGTGVGSLYDMRNFLAGTKRTGLSLVVVLFYFRSFLISPFPPFSFTSSHPRWSHYSQPACLVCFHVCACVTSCISKHKQVFFFLDASLKTSQNERLCWHCWESWDARLLTVLENRVRRFAGAGGGEGVCW